MPDDHPMVEVRHTVQPQKTKKKQRKDTRATDSTAETTDHTTSSMSGSRSREAQRRGSRVLRASPRVLLLLLLLLQFHLQLGGVKQEAKSRGHRKKDVWRERPSSSHRKAAVQRDI
ncbi:UNVERIFIED_CONTAM: hypothetical protein Sindi_0213700 [Sesamum indicum]